MAGRKRPPLVAEICRLLIEYPAKDWKALTDGLRDRALIEDLAAALEDAVALVEKSKKGRPRKHPKPRMSVLARVAQEDGSKAEVLGALESRLTDGDQGVTLAHIRGFASSLGMKEELPRRRKQAVEQIIRHLATRTTVEIQAALRAAAPAPRPSDQEYDRWVDLILGSGATPPGQRNREPTLSARDEQASPALRRDDSQGRRVGKSRGRLVGKV